MRPLLVLDGDSLAHRAYHALPGSIRDGAGRPANMLVGFGGMLATLWEAERPRALLVAFDTLGTPTFRHELLPGYQAGREFAPALLEQLDRLPELVRALGFAVAKEPGYEADDFLAAAARAEERRGGRARVVTSDRDAFQLVSDRVTVLLPRKGVSELERVAPADVLGRYGVEPALVPDFIALRGDASDHIPGARGIGPAKAAAVLREHGSLGGALAAGRFGAEGEALRLYLRVATMRDDAPLEPIPDADPDWAGGAALAGRWGLGRLERRLTALADASDG